MAEVKVLVEGYVREEDNKEFASCTTTLIRDKELNIIVDPGMNKKMLISALNKEGLTSGDIDYVILTHTHLDHSLLAGMFDGSKILDDSNVFSFDGEIGEHEGIVFGTDIKIFKTPGHDQFHCSVIVETSRGKEVVAGDLFWWRDDEEQITDRESLLDHEDPYVKDKKKLRESRERILDIADYIIPGHGKIFEVEI